MDPADNAGKIRQVANRNQLHFAPRDPCHRDRGESKSEMISRAWLLTRIGRCIFRCETGTLPKQTKNRDPIHEQCSSRDLRGSIACWPAGGAFTLSTFHAFLVICGVAVHPVASDDLEPRCCDERSPIMKGNSQRGFDQLADGSEFFDGQTSARIVD